MLIYRNDGKLFCISKKALQLAGYHDIEHFNAEHNDYSELFIKRPGYIYNFENFSWLTFLRNAYKEQKKVLIATKDNAIYECELAMETIYPVDFDENTPEFFYQIEFKNLRLSNGSSLMQEDLENMPTAEEAAFEDKILKDAYSENEMQTVSQTSLEYGPELGQDSGLTESEGIQEQNEYTMFDMDIQTSSPAKTEDIDKPLDLVDFEFDFEEKKGENEPFQEPQTKPQTEPATIQQENENTDEPLFEIDRPQTPPKETTDFKPATAATPLVCEETPFTPPDIARASFALGVPESIIKEYIKEFLTTYMQRVPEIKAAMIARNLPAVRKEAIKLKGVASNLGMETLANTLEALLKANTNEEVASIWEKVDAYMRQLICIYSPELAPKDEQQEPKRVFEPEQKIEMPLFDETEEKLESAQKPESALNLEEKDTGETIIFNPNEAADALGLPESLILEFVNDFIQQARDEMKNFEHAYEKNDIETINEIAHKLKGVAANLRIEDMRQLMENVQHAKNPKEVEDELVNFYHKLAALAKMMAKEYA